MKIVKPLTLGILHRPYRYRGRHRLAVAVLGFFKLGGGAADRFLTENLQWAKLVPLLPQGMPLDHILPKARAEVMLSGSAYAPGEPVKAMTVRMQCGAVDKHLCVTGERQWRRTLGLWRCMDEAQPFTQMPLIWENAYGGPDYAGNPLGCGYLPRLACWRQPRGRLPTVQTPQAAIRPGRRRHVPGGFAPMNLLHSPMRTRSGTYDKRWLEEDFPGLPRDFDFGVFNLSSSDQQFDGRFSGRESYRLEGLHPQQAILCGTLPGLHARAFILRQEQHAAQAEEIPLNCDTVWFFPDQDIGMLVYRGETEIADSDGLDVRALMAAYERVDDAPRSLAHYREVFELRLDANTAGLHAFNEAQLAPPHTPEAMAARAAARARRAAEELAKRQELLDEAMADFWQHSGMTPPADYAPPRAEPPLLSGPSTDELAEGEFDLAEMKAQAEVLAEQVKREAEAKLAAIAVQNKAPTSPDPAVAAREALEKASVLAKDLIDNDDSDPLPQLQRAGRNAALSPTTLDAPLPAAAALALRRLVQQALRDGASLAGRDLAGADLHGLDLDGLDLREVQLERADLRGAKLVGANLHKAVLTAADVSGADLSGARLDQANLCETRALATCFVGADLCGARAMKAVWTEADLRGAKLDDFLAVGIDLSGAKLDDSVWTRGVISGAKAARSSWRNVRWHSVVAVGGDFGNADFSGAGLERSVLMDAQLAASHWQEAKLVNVYGGGKANWESANLQSARFSRCGLRGARLNGADMRNGIFAQSDFGQADLSDAIAHNARFYRSLFMQSRLRRVQGRGADFFQTLCRKADFSQASLPYAVLQQADTADAVWGGADLGGVLMPRKARL